MKTRLRFVVGLASLIVVGGTLFGFGFFFVSGFSPNQELPLALLAPIGGPTGPVAFINRALEPSIRVSPAPDNTVYVSSIRGVPGGVDLWRSYAPIDGGPNGDGTYNFKYEGQPDGCGVLANGCQFLGIAEGGGDVDIAVNYPPSGIPNLALVSLTLAPGITGTHSTDRGDTFSQPNPAVALIPGDDRQWIDGTGAQTVYLNYHDVATFNIEVQRSVDGGVNYTDGFGEAIDPQTFPATGGVPASNSGSVHGQIRIDRSPTSCSSGGNLYQIFVAPDSVTENVTGGALRSVYVGVSTDAKLGLPAFTFTDTKVFAESAGPNREGAVNLFPALATDDFGFVYAVWSDNTNIRYAFSKNQGTTWSAPITVNSGATAGMSKVFPWVAADANGHVGIVWFGADRAGNSNDASIHAPCPSMSTTCMSGWTNWNGYYAESVNGHDTIPVFAQSVISDHVIHRGTVSTGGLGGGANRNLGDLFQIAFDSQHRANVAFSDDHKLHPNSITGHTGNDDPQARRLIRANFTHQLNANSGINTGGSCAGSPPPPPPGAVKVTGGGRVTSQTPAQTANFGFVANSNKPNASLSYHDDGATGGKIDVHSANTSEPQMTFSGNCVTFKGDAKVNQKPGYSYTVNACDNAEPGAGKDTFFISVTGPNFSYSNGGPITQGNIQSHSQ